MDSIPHPETRLAIRPMQRKKVRDRLELAERTLRSCLEETLNLEFSTRRAIERAVDYVIACHAPLNQQPTATGKEAR